MAATTHTATIISTDDVEIGRVGVFIRAAFHVLVFWTLTYCILYLLKKWGGVKTNGRWSFKFGEIKFYTEQWNGLFYRVGGPSSSLHRFLSTWFSIGVVVSLCCSLVSVILLGANLFSLLRWFFAYVASRFFDASLSQEQLSEGDILTPLIPGVNVPWREMVFYFGALGISAIFHELGHALAAVGERKHINGVGAFILFVYPGAFVDLREDTFVNIPPWKQLKIACAGAWHNIVLSGAAILLAFVLLPALLFPFYQREERGAVISSISTNSVLDNTISPGDVITSVNDCEVNQRADNSNWRSCLLQAMNGPSPGYCFPTLKLPSLTNSCISQNSSHSCFSDTKNNLYSLYARDVVTEDAKVCVDDQDCNTSGKGDDVCLHFIFEENQLTPLASKEKLIRVSVRGKRFILFAGHPSELWNAVEVDQYIGRRLLSIEAFSLPCWIPSRLKTFFIYLASLSSALGVINIAPIFYLDGHWVVSALLRWGHDNHNPQLEAKHLDYILKSGTVLLASNMALSIFKMLLQ